MLLAAGKGTRLRPLTDTTPKCLVTAGGRTLLEHNLRHLQQAGVETVIINVHHLAQQVMDYVAHLNLQLDIRFSVEETLLETGGGLWQARRHFEDEAAFLVINSDIYTDLDLGLLLQAHLRQQNLATLAVAHRDTSRYLRFNKRELLCGWEDQRSGKQVSWSREAYDLRAFNGIQVLGNGIFEYLKDRGPVFATIPAFLDAARAGEQLKAYTMDTAFWMDIGTPEKLTRLNHYLEQQANTP